MGYFISFAESHVGSSLAQMFHIMDQKTRAEALSSHVHCGFWWSSGPLPLIHWAARGSDVIRDEAALDQPPVFTVLFADVSVIFNVSTPPFQPFFSVSEKTQPHLSSQKHPKGGNDFHLCRHAQSESLCLGNTNTTRIKQIMLITRNAELAQCVCAKGRIAQWIPFNKTVGLVSMGSLLVGGCITTVSQPSWRPLAAI